MVLEEVELLSWGAISKGNTLHKYELDQNQNPEITYFYPMNDQV